MTLDTGGGGRALPFLFVPKQGFTRRNIDNPAT